MADSVPSSTQVTPTGAISWSSIGAWARRRWLPLFLVVTGITLAISLVSGQATGQNWQRLPLSGGLPLTVLAHPLLPTTLLSGTDQGLLLSPDSGRSWQRPASGLPANQSISALVATPDATRFYAGGSGGVYLSLDQGMTWKPVTNGLPSGEVYDALALMSDDGQMLLAGTAHSGAFVSQDGGATWTPSQNGLPDQADIYTVTHSVDGKVWYAGTVGHGVFRSDDRGANWTAMNAGLPEGSNVFALLALPASKGVAAALLAATQAGVYRSTDDGAHWVVSSSGIGTQRVLTLAVDPTASPVVAAGTDSGIAVSTNGGTTWAVVGKGDLLTQKVGHAIITHPQRDTTVIFATAEHLYRYPGEVNPTLGLVTRIAGIGLFIGLLFWIGGRQNRVVRQFAPPEPPSGKYPQTPGQPQASFRNTIRKTGGSHIRGGPPPQSEA